MDKLSAIRSILGKAYVASEEQDGDYWCEGEPAQIEIERTDEDEIRIGVEIRGNHVDAATIYLERSEAIRIVLALAQAVGDR